MPGRSHAVTRHFTLSLVVASVAAFAACGEHGHVHADARAADIGLPAESRVVAARVSRGETLASLLLDNDVQSAEVNDVVDRARAVFDPRRVRADQPYRLEQASDGELQRFEYQIDGDRLLRVRRSGGDGDPFVAEVVAIEKTRETVVVRGTIDRRTPSLFEAMDAAGEGIDLSIGLADVFGGEIDFNTDLQPGDRFEVVVDKQYRACGAAAMPCDGNARTGRVFAGYGPILAAEFDNEGRRLRAVRYSPPGGDPGYYDAEGRSMRRFFLRSPLKFQPVITSAFSRARLHPILKTVRPHLGVDYRAPFGSPVIAVANGTVVQAGMAGGAGRLVHLRHANGYETEYLHLSSIAVHVGQHVHQGDVVGRVGQSGLATAPHLDFRIRKNGLFVNPVTAQRAMPPGDPIPGAQMAAFVAVRDRVLREIQPPAAAAADTTAAAHQP